MTHDSAVHTIVSLAPKMAHESAETVLTKYASENDLPPAQLEKLAQVYNTLRTVSHIDNAPEAERGSSVPLVDVPELVVGYATGWDQEKAAADPLSFSSHDVNSVDLNVLLKRELKGDLEKAASEVTGSPSEIKEKMQIEISREEVDEVLLDMQVDLEDRMAKIAGELLGAAPVEDDNVFRRDVSEFEEEALQRCGEEAVKMAGTYLDAFAEPHRIQLTRFGYDTEITKYAYEIPHAEGEKMAELAKLCATHDAITKLAAGVSMEELAEHTSPDAEFVFGDARVDPNKADPDSKEEAPTEGADKALEKGDQEGLTSDNKGEGNQSGDRPQKRTEEEEKTEAKSEGGGAAGAAGRGKRPSRIGAIAGGTVGAIGAGVRGTAKGIDSVLQKVTSKERQNKPQRAADIDVEDIRRAMNLSRMIANDPVLKESDPKEVLEIYNSIVRRNPEMAGDMASLRLLLREAVNYEGLTLDSQKMLSEIRRNEAQGEAQSDENTKKRYAVGGASALIPGTK